MKASRGVAKAALLLAVTFVSGVVSATASEALDTPWGPAPTVQAVSGTLTPGQVYRVPANPSAGFHFPYFFTVPRTLNAGYPVLCSPNNDGQVGIPAPQRDYFASILNEELHNAMGSKLGVVALTPSFPRPASEHNDNLYVHALTRAVITTQKTELYRVDRQLLAMQADLRRQLADAGISVSDSLLLYGFSAAADFVTRLTALHPGRVEGVVAGGLGGLPILPVSHLNGELLTYPVGVGDFYQMAGKSFDAPAFSQTPMLMVQGTNDENDSVPEGSELEEEQRFSSDSYSYQQAVWINAQLGSVPVNRLPQVRDVYQSLEPVDFAFAELAGERDTDKKIKPYAVFFDCVLSRSGACAHKIKTEIEAVTPGFN
ncbi:hypothetical protein [Alteromonas sp. CYL-A6]|uniref:hypothetical protein n=1 Tax=Alteromonas nitratireducens TaxID=3390813 RepID=UPI0034A8E068